MIDRRQGAAALMAAGLIGFGLLACSSEADRTDGGKAATNGSAASSTPSMSAADLQRSLAARISTATPPQSVACAAGLVGEVGKTATCEVAVSDAVSVQANVTVTKVNGNSIDYDFTSTMTQAQLEKAFTAKASAQTACDGGKTAPGDTPPHTHAPHDDME